MEGPLGPFLVNAFPLPSLPSMLSPKLNPEALYRQIGGLLADMPDLQNGSQTPETERWLGRAFALVEATGDHLDIARFKAAWEELHGMDYHWPSGAKAVRAILERALARAEIRAPGATRGAFVTTGATFDAFQAIGKVFETAKRELLIVDPYLNEKVLTDFAPLAGPDVALQLLCDSAAVQASSSLKVAAARWEQQYGGLRLLYVRATAPRLLHDRLIVVDDSVVWSLTQSLKDFANRSPASVVRVDADIAALKLQAYRELWAFATPLV